MLLLRCVYALPVCVYVVDCCLLFVVTLFCLLLPLLFTLLHLLFTLRCCCLLIYAVCCCCVYVVVGTLLLFDFVVDFTLFYVYVGVTFTFVTVTLLLLLPICTLLFADYPVVGLRLLRCVTFYTARYFPFAVTDDCHAFTLFVDSFTHLRLR